MRVTRRQFLAATTAFGPASAQPAKPHLRRQDSFFGIHFDLHANNRDTALGRDVTEEMITRFLERVKPDYVQYDCKGHVGYMAYPSKVSASAPTVQDSLAIWRKATARHGVALYIHFSGVWDSRAVADHPEWARVRPDGKQEDRQTSTFGPYADLRMIPQLKEAAATYDLDGAWIDGECWATNPDYCAAAAEAFRKATGISELPKSSRDKGWLEFLELNREQFRRHVRHYVEELHAFRPSFQIASNWLYSTYVPERPTLPVDFVSGDYLGSACISAARTEARYLSQIGRPWDLMAWGFQSGRNNPVGPIHKPAAQLMQEAAVVLAQGGGFQIYYQPTRAGRIDDRHVNVMAKVAAFCRARQNFCHQAEPVPQVGVLFSKKTLYETSGKLFGGWGARENPVRGMVDALVENHLPVDVIPDWKIEEAAARYPAIVVPDWEAIGEELKAPLNRYAEAGGRLLLAGAQNAALFSDALGVRMLGTPSDRPAWIAGEEVFANVRGLWQDVEARGAEVIEARFPTYDSTRDGKCAATLAVRGKGKIAAIYGPIGSVFALTHSPEVRRLVGRLMGKLFTPMVEVDAPPAVEAVLKHKGARTILHLVNSTGMQVADSYAAVDSVPAVGPIAVRIRASRAPTHVLLEPGAQPVSGRWAGGVYAVEIPRLEIMSTLTWL